MKCLIVDDEPAARARLVRLLAAHADVQVVGQAHSGDEALQRVLELAPDLLFLDVQMPGASGLDVAASLPDPAPAVIFVTAFDRYAIEAFDADAMDYLLKPAEPERLARALERFRARSVAAPRRLPPPAQLLIPDRGRTHVLPLAEIRWLEAADNYVAVHGEGRAPLLRRTLAALLQDLGDGFMRTHRSAAVALAHVQQVAARDSGEATVLLSGGQQAPCSRQFRAALMERLSSLPR